MLRTMLKGLLAHKARLVMTTLAIVLGVMFFTASLVFADTLDRAQQAELSKIALPDVIVLPKVDFADTSAGPPAESSTTIAAAAVATVRAVDGVQTAEGAVSGAAQLLRADGRPVDPESATGRSVTADPRLGLNYEIADGRLPNGPQEAVLDQRSADEQGLRPGASVKVLVEGRPQTFTLAGTLRPRNGDVATMARQVAFDLPTAQQLFDREDAVDRIGVVAAPGTSADVLEQRVKDAVGKDYSVQNGESLRREVEVSVGDSIQIVRTLLLVFVGITLFVGSFIVATTFAMILAQRTRELALLRCTGASRGQLFGAMLAEGAAVGAGAGVLGVGAGVGVAAGFLAAVGGELPDSGLAVTPATVLLGLLVGVGLTVLASLASVVRATRVPPIAALRQDAVPQTPRTRLVRVILGAAMTGLGAILLLAGLAAGSGGLVGGASVLLFLGVVALIPVLVRPLVRLLSWPLQRLFGLAGQLAGQNAVRNPRRTAATAAALMIGLTLVVAIGSITESTRAAGSAQIRDRFTAEVFLSGQQAPLPAEVLTAVGGLPETGTVARIGSGTMQVDGDLTTFGAVDPAAYQQAVRVRVAAGNLEDLERGGLAVSKADADRKGWTTGQQIDVAFPGVGLQKLTVRAVVESDPLGDGYLMSLQEYQRLDQRAPIGQALIVPRAGVGADALRRAVEQAVGPFPDTKVQDRQALIADGEKTLDRALVILTSLLGLSVLIALLGVVNTLALSVFERTRELGMLRAVGMNRGQVRAMVRGESVVITLLGTLLGLVLGVGFGAAIVQGTSGGQSDPVPFVAPVGLIAAAVGGALAVGLLAAVLPARRAAKVDVLRAVTADG